MDLNFLVPAAAFTLATVILSWLVASSQMDTLAALVRIVLPSVVVAGVSWLLWRLVMMHLDEATVNFHHLIRGTSSESTNLPVWTGAAYFGAMVAGMAAHTVWLMLPKIKGSHPLSFDRWQFVRPALVAPIIFLAVWKTVGSQPLGVEPILLSFQNGFFWQTVLSKHT